MDTDPMRQWSSDSEGELDSAREENPLLLLPPPGASAPAPDPHGKYRILTASGSLTTAAAAVAASGRTATDVRCGSEVVAQDECRGSTAASSCLEMGCPGKRILLEFGDEYDGEVKFERGAAVPHGRGTLRSLLGKHCYVGDFVNRGRDGYGKLTTERYVIWSKWKMNRPDTASSARVDYVNGDRYSGFLSLRQDSAAAQQLSRSSRARMSKFSIWAQTTMPVRERWGELVGANGDRYFGQWENNLPSGFGCLMTSSGDRYVGLFEAGKFHDTGTLFSTLYGGCDYSNSLLDGASFVYEQRQQRSWQTDGAEEEGDANDGGESPATGIGAEKEQQAQQLQEQEQEQGHESQQGRWHGVIFDGVWEKGRFAGEGHVTLPCGSRVSAEWRNASQPTNGRLFIGSSSRRGCHTQDGMNTGGWFQCFHWEALLCGVCEESKARKYTACTSYRERLCSATTHEEAQAVLADFCTNEDAVVNALKVFRRCFYFLHGTCGRSCAIGSGPGSNRLGWCYLRNAYGGCIHHGRGHRIGVGDVDLAMTDITSFVRSVVRWAVEMMGDAAVASSRSEMFIARRILDYVLRDVHDVLFNLYVHAYGEEDIALSAALERLREKMTLDDLGVVFARQQTAERLFDPYTDAIHCIEQLGCRAQTFSSKLQVLTRWSKEIDLSVRLAQVNLDDGSFAPSPSHGGQLDLGSADDLLPIHQYVLMKARLPHLYAHTKLLVDLGSEDIFMEFTSKDNFFIITLHACATTFVKLHPLLRDEHRVLSPPSLFEDRLRTSVAAIRRTAICFLDAFASHAGAEVCPVSDPVDLHDIALGYLRAWLPAAMDALSATPRVGCRSGGDCRVVAVTELLESKEARELVCLDEPHCSRSVALFCWLAAASITSVLNMRIGLATGSGALGSDDILQVDVSPTVFLEQYRCWADASGAREVVVVVLLLLPMESEKMLRPSFLHRAAALLLTLL